MGITLAALADMLGAELRGDPGREVTSVGSLEHAGDDAVSFCANARHLQQLRATVLGIRRGKMGRIPEKCRRQPLGHPRTHRIRELLKVFFFKKHHHARSPVVIRGHRCVIAQNFRPRPDQRGRIAKV